MDKEKLTDAIASHLRTVRNLTGISPEEAAERAGGEISASYIRRLENGVHVPSVVALWLLCVAYGTTLENFFSSLRIEAKKTA